MKSQNDIAWEAFFEKYQVLARIEKEGVFIANASQMKAYREPRLMAKFDHHINLPKIFTQNHLAILPVSRGDYIIAPFQAYHAFEPAEQTITHVSLPSHLQSLRINDISSETIAINCALASGILSDFLEEDILYAAVSGRMGSGQFDFQMQDSQFRSFISVSVDNSQIEIDAAFEGTRSLSLIEAKRDLSEDFLIRQLYYPFRLWHSRITKQVKPVFLVYSNGIFHLYEYTFQNMERYNSLLLIKHKNYTIEDTAIEFSDLLEIAKGVQPVPEPEISFPQANSLERVINLCELLNTQPLSREQVTERYAFDTRQTNYYTDAARYLGLLEKQYGEKHKPVYFLSSFGKRVMQLNYKQRQLAFCEAILQHRPFLETFQWFVKTGFMPNTEVIADIMRASGLYHVKSATTYERRSSTISSWIVWMIGLTK